MSRKRKKWNKKRDGALPVIMAMHKCVMRNHEESKDIKLFMVYCLLQDGEITFPQAFDLLVAAGLLKDDINDLIYRGRAMYVSVSNDYPKYMDDEKLADWFSYGKKE